MLYLQIREYIYQSRIYCPPEHAFLLASYAVQERYGDHNVDLHKADQVAQFKLIPKRWEIKTSSLPKVAYTPGLCASDIM